MQKHQSNTHITLRQGAVKAAYFPQTMQRSVALLTLVVLWMALAMAAFMTMAWPKAAHATDVAITTNDKATNDKAAHGKQSIDWQSASAQTFARARAENKLILLDLEAVWCHWCHVMDEQTYADPQVAALLAKHYIAIKADHDARPDLAERYRDYGWPATIIFTPDGREIVKRAGYIAPDAMRQLLLAVVKDPTPEAAAQTELPKQFANSPLLDAATRQQLERAFINTHDYKLGGLKLGQKFVDRDTVEYALLRAHEGDATAARIAQQDLDGGLKLLDPAWGGVYQYSTHGDWQHLHYEKLAFIQAEYLRVYALAYAQFQHPRYAQAMREIHRYLRGFLQAPDGAFYVSQDADLVQGQHSDAYFKLGDAARRKQGIPRVDTHIYARENGLLIAALATAYAATGEVDYLQDAQRAANYVLQHHALPQGGYSHDQLNNAVAPKIKGNQINAKASEQNNASPMVFLADNLGMLRGWLSLYMATGERTWLEHAVRTADFIEAHFKAADHPGYVVAAQSVGVAALPNLDENMALARQFNLLRHYTGQTRFANMAEHAMRYVVTPEVALSRVTEAGVLLAARELGGEPTHLTVVGAKDDPQAQALFQAALAYPAVYRRVEWWDVREGPMPNADVQYPPQSRAAAYVCSDSRCSRPVFKPAQLAPLADQVSGIAKP